MEKQYTKTISTAYVKGWKEWANEHNEKVNNYIQGKADDLTNDGYEKWAYKAPIVRRKVHHMNTVTAVVNNQQVLITILCCEDEEAQEPI